MFYLYMVESLNFFLSLNTYKLLRTVFVFGLFEFKTLLEVHLMYFRMKWVQVDKYGKIPWDFICLESQNLQ